MTEAKYESGARRPHTLLSYGRAGSVLQWGSKIGNSLDEPPAGWSTPTVGVEDVQSSDELLAGRPAPTVRVEDRPSSDELLLDRSSPMVGWKDWQSLDELRPGCHLAAMADPVGMGAGRSCVTPPRSARQVRQAAVADCERVKLTKIVEFRR
jgi:hypothetical protein